MNKRGAVLALAALGAAPLAAIARQSGKIWRIGVLRDIPPNAGGWLNSQRAIDCRCHAAQSVCLYQ